jgi:hypothetical protein
MSVTAPPLTVRYPHCRDTAGPPPMSVGLIVPPMQSTHTVLSPSIVSVVESRSPPKMPSDLWAKHPSTRVETARVCSPDTGGLKRVTVGA